MLVHPPKGQGRRGVTQGTNNHNTLISLSMSRSSRILADFGQLGSVTRLGVQVEWARDEAFRSTGLCDEARHSDRLGPRSFSRSACDRARDELGRPPWEGMMVEVPNIMNVVEVSKFYRGFEMKSIGVWTLAVSTPQCRGDYQQRVTDPRRL
jgi:hypothetical protein